MRPYFLPKTAGNGLIYNTFEKSTAFALAGNQAGGSAFCIFRAFGESVYRTFVVATVKQ